MKHVRIDGNLTVPQRRTAVDKFQNTPDIRVMLLTYGSGSVGFVTLFATCCSQLTLASLNLETASYVHLLEPHWNPMVEAQAAARIDRLSQTKDIFIFRYIVQDSIEEVSFLLDKCRAPFKSF